MVGGAATQNKYHFLFLTIHIIRCELSNEAVEAKNISFDSKKVMTAA